MEAEKIKVASMKKQIAMMLLVLCAGLGAVTLWENIFPPSMTANCAYLIEKYPPENFSFIDDSARDETLKCLYTKWRYNQKTWKINENYIAR